MTLSLLLALPPDRFAAASVQDAGPEWVERFRQLNQRMTEQGAVRILNDKLTEKPHDKAD